MKRVKVRYPIKGDYYRPKIYRTKIIKLKLPTDDHGFYLFGQLAQLAENCLREVQGLDHICVTQLQVLDCY